MNTRLFEFDPAPANLRKELQRSVGESKLGFVEATAASLGCSLEAYVEDAVNAPGGAADRVGREHLSAPECADALRLARIKDFLMEQH